MNKQIVFRKFSPLLVAALLLPLAGYAGNCLWKATSDHGTLYLQGSVHLLKAGDYPLAPAIEEAYAQSRLVVFETDMKAMISPETQQLIMKKALLPDGRTLEKELGTEIYSMLSKELSESGLPPAMTQQFKPWFATLTLTLLRMQAMGLDPNLGLDQYFYGKAVKDGKEVIGLETVEFQINLFDALSEGNQDGYTKHALKELEQLETALDEMLEAWRSGNLAKLDEITMDGFKEYPELYKQFVTDRNQTWIKELDKLSNKGKTCMVVVGVAHLAGKEGLLELLKARGYTVEQL